MAFLQPKAGHDYPGTLPEFEKFFPDEAACQAYLEQLRWPEGFVCPTCAFFGQAWINGRALRICPRCRKQVSTLAGTIFHRSRIPLRTWFLAAWEMTSTKHGTTALDIQRTLGIRSYRTAWRMAHKLRAAMVRADRTQLSGIIEADETYVGAAEQGTRGRETLSKAIVAIAVEIGPDTWGRVRLRSVPDVSAMSIIRFLTDVVTPGSEIHTDGWPTYRQLQYIGFKHEATILSDSSDPAHVAMPAAHRVASLLKRWLLGVEQGGIATAHLPVYLEEFTFRFNRRHSKTRGLLFYRLLEQAVHTAPLPEKDIVKHTGRGVKS